MGGTITVSLSNLLGLWIQLLSLRNAVSASEMAVEFHIGEETRIKQLGPWLLFRIHQKCLLCTIPPQSS